ncbi:hypothetical protein WDU94_011518 [Cyamophila willieti]
MAKRGGGYNLCAALYCNHNRKRNPNLSFFRFPKNPKVCRQWIINSKRFDLLNKEPSYLYTNCIICADHFADSQFTTKAKNRLLDNAVPTKFPIGAQPEENKISESVGQEICEQVEKQMKETSPGIVIKGKRPMEKPERMISTSIFKESKELLSTKTVTFSSRPRIITTQIPESRISSANIVSLPNTSKVTSVNTSDKPRLIWLTGLPMSQKPASTQGSLVKSVLPNVPMLGTTSNVPLLGSSVSHVPMPGKPITPGVESSLCLLPEVKREVTEIPGTSDSNNDNFAPSDYSYAGSYDGSHYHSSVLLDNTNNQDGGSHDNTFDTSYDESSAPPPLKRKRPCAGNSTEQLSENYIAFSELVVSKLKSLPPHRAALLQLKIQELLSREIVSMENEEVDEGTEDDSDLNEDEEEVEENGQTKPGSSSEAPAAANRPDPSTRPEDCPTGAEDKDTAQTGQRTTLTSSTVTTIAKKRKSRGKMSDNKENSQAFLEESYRAFSRCIISQLRYLPTSIAVITQNKIQKVISEDIIEFYTKKDLNSNQDETSSSAVRIKEEPIESMEN